MKNLQQLIKITQKVASDNSPAILTALGVTGVVTTAYLTGKATFKAAKILEDEEMARNIKREIGKPRIPVTGKDKFLLLWKLYIPAVTSGVLSCGAIVYANRIGTRRAVAVAAAYNLSERAFTEYKEKVVETIGRNKEQTVRDEIAQDRVDRAGEPGVVFLPDGKKVLCHDAFSNQYFMSTMEDLQRAENQINKQILHSDFARVDDLYHQIASDGLKPTSISSEMGWNTDKMLEINYSTVLHDERTPCISMEFATIPIREPWRFC